MSWNFRKVGQNKDLLKAAVQAEFAPQAIKDEVCARIDAIPTFETHAILVESSGHLDAPPDMTRPWKGSYDIKIHVDNVPFINTPAA